MKRDRLLCFPKPLVPAKGFSCRRAMRPCLVTTSSMTYIDDGVGQEEGGSAGVMRGRGGALGERRGQTGMTAVFEGVRA